MRTGIPEIGLSRLPIDFIVQNLYGGNPLSTYSLIVHIIKEWQREYGYCPETEFFIGEWSDGGEPFRADREETYLASFIIASLVGMDRAGIDRQTFSHLGEQQVKEKTQFCGGFGLFTKDCITRPTFHAFKALSELGQTRLEVSSSDPWIFGIAGKDENRVVFVVANYVPRPRVLSRLPFDRLLQRGYLFSDIITYFKDIKTLDQIFQGDRDLSHFKAPPKMEADILAIRSEYQNHENLLREREKSAVRITLELKELSWLGPFVCKEYRIDSKHSNPVRSKEEIDRIINKRKKDIEEDLDRKLDDILIKQGYSREEAQLMEDFMNLRDKRAFSIPESKQDRFMGMIRYIEKYRINKLAEDINKRPDVRFQQINEKQMSATNFISLTLELEPNSVSLIVLEKRTLTAMDEPTHAKELI